MEEVELLQATVDAVGEADNEIGGFRQTRVREFTEVIEATPSTFLWYFGVLVSNRNPVEMVTGRWFRGESDGRVFEILGITDLGGGIWRVDYDLRGEPIPLQSGWAPTATVTWNGTTTVVTTNPNDFPVGTWITVTTGGNINWFEIVGKNGNNLTITNPHSLPIPTIVEVDATFVSSDPRISLVVEELEVESVLNWPDVGSIALDGMLYQYTSKTLSPMVLKGISHFDAGQDIVGLRQTHSVGAVVTDVTRDYSALELTRNAMLVDYADGEDLNALGRNYGVLRYPFLQSDDIFREIIKALAYNPRGTMFGLELALDAMVGEGNYELYEDLVNHPCTVFVRLLGDAALEDRSTGKALLTGAEVVDPTSPTSVPISGTVVARGSVYSVRLKDHVHDGDFRYAKPSTFNIEDIPGSPVQAWTYYGTAGATEAVNVIQLAGSIPSIRINHTAGGVSRYYGIRRFAGRYSDWSVDCVMLIPLGAVLLTSSGSTQQWAVQVLDGSHFVCWGCYQDPGDANKYFLRLTSAGTLLGNGIRLDKAVYYSIQLRKRGGYDGVVELLVDGKVVDREARADFTVVATNRRIRFGIHVTSAPITVYGDLVQLSFNIHTPGYDYWNLYEDNATAGAPNDIQITTSEFQSGDVGKRIEVQGSTVTNPYGGNNNGKFEVSAYTDANNIEVQGVEQVDGASVETVNPLRITVDPRKQQFVFPDDLGKEIVLLDSAQGNNGTYVIEKLLHPDTFDDLEADFSTRLRTVTNVCEIEEPTPSFEFVSETAINFRLNPVFVTEGSLDIILSDAGSESGGTLTLREALPGGDFIVDVWYNEVLSALVLLDFSIKNEIVQVLPDLLWQYYPFYLSDPLGFVRAYLDDITAAGVIPEYFVE
jgi:hypothetical protein